MQYKTALFARRRVGGGGRGASVLTRAQFGSSLRKFTQTKVGLLKGKLKEGKLKNLQPDLQHPQNIFSLDSKSSEAAISSL
jgi:hypothetical protein